MNEETKALLDEADRILERTKQQKVKKCKVRVDEKAIDAEFARYEPNCETCEG